MIKAISTYTISSYLSAIFSFILIPILTKYLEPSSFGIISATTSLIAIFQIFGLSLNGSISRSYLIKNSDIKHVIGGFTQISLISFSVLAALVFTLREFISAHTGIPPDWLIFIPVLAFFQFYISAYLALCQAAEHLSEYSTIQIGQAALSTSATLLLVVTINWNWEGRLIAIGISSCIVFFVILFLLSKNKWLSFSTHKAFISQSIKFGAGLLPYQAGGLLSNYSDRLYITNLIGAHELGIYTASLQLTSIFSIFIDAINKAYTPWLYQRLNDPTIEMKWQVVKHIYLSLPLFLIGAALAFYGLKSISPFIYDEKYINSDKYFIWLVLGYSVNGMQNMITNIIFYSNKTYFLSTASIISGVINVAITPLLIKLNGAIGAAQAMLVTNIIMLILCWLLSTKAYPMPWLGYK